MLWWGVGCCSVLQYVAVCCGRSNACICGWGVGCCSLLQYVAISCSVLQFVAVCCGKSSAWCSGWGVVRCNVLHTPTRGAVSELGCDASSPFSAIFARRALKTLCKLVLISAEEISLTLVLRGVTALWHPEVEVWYLISRFPLPSAVYSRKWVS